MLSLLFLIPIALLLTGLMIWAFVWAVRNGQYEDLERASKEALYDDSADASANTSLQNSNQDY